MLAVFELYHHFSTPISIHIFLWIFSIQKTIFLFIFSNLCSKGWNDKLRECCPNVNILNTPYHAAVSCQRSGGRIDCVQQMGFLVTKIMVHYWNFLNILFLSLFWKIIKYIYDSLSVLLLQFCVCLNFNFLLSTR